MQWNQVGENLTKTPVQVGALNCLNHQDLCWSLGVNKYPTLLAVNYLGSLSGTAESPAFKKLDVRGGPIEKIMGIINAVHPPAVEVDETPEDGVNGSPRRTEEPTRKHEQTAVQKRITKQLEQESAPCALRMEDAVVSVRWVLSYDVFDRGTELSPERKGEFGLSTSRSAGRQGQRHVEYFWVNQQNETYTSVTYTSRQMSFSRFDRLVSGLRLGLNGFVQERTISFKSCEP